MPKESQFGNYLKASDLRDFVEKLRAPSIISSKMNNYINENKETGFLVEGDPAAKVNKLVDEIFRRIVGAPVTDLSAAERTEIERICGEFFAKWDSREQFSDFH